MPRQRLRFDSHLPKKMKESVFLAWLKRKLMLAGYSIAIPEPDMGEDIWIGSWVDRLHDVAPRTIVRGQIKSLYSCEENPTKHRRKYDCNDVLRTLDYAVEQPGFVYFIGIRDDRTTDYHLGCLPTRSLLRRVREKATSNGVLGGRFKFTIFVDAPKSGSQFQFFLFVTGYGRFDVTPFFGSDLIGLRTEDPDVRMLAEECAARPIISRTLEKRAVARLAGKN